jgi:hypothetical protein
MKKINNFFLIILIVVIISITLDAEAVKLNPVKFKNKECVKTLNELCIDPTIKSFRGWRRVCNNNKIVLYTCDGDGVNKIILDKACECLTTDETMTGINSFFIFKEER